MKRPTLFALACTSLFTLADCRGDLIDAWDFYRLTATSSAASTPATIAATVGTGSLDASAFSLGCSQGSNPERTSLSGDQLNTFSGSQDTAANGTSLA